MLAKYLREAAGPVRYAGLGIPSQTPADQVDSTRNYLQLVSRAYGVPRFGASVLRGVERPPGMLHQLLGGVVHEGDPAALAQFLDVHHDVTGMPIPQPPHLGATNAIGFPSDHAEFLDTLASMYHNLAGATPNATPPSRFTTTNLRDSWIQRALSENYTRAIGYPSPLDHIVASLTQHPPARLGGEGNRDRLEQLYAEPLPTGDFHGFRELYDLLHNIALHGPDARVAYTAGQGLDRVQEILHRLVHSV